MHLTRFDDLDTNYGPDFAADLEAVISEVERATEASVALEKEGQAVRFAHAKAYGLMHANVEVLPVDDSRYAQGLFASPGRYPALIRYSNGLGHLGSDVRLGAACGMAIKLFGVPGPSLSDEPDAGTMDYNLINHPVFFANTARDYITIARLFNELPEAPRDASRKAKWLYDFVTRDGSLPWERWLWDELFAMFGAVGKPMPHLLHTTFWSMGAVRHGDYVAKVRAAPVTVHPGALLPIEPTPAAHPIRDALVSDARGADHAFDLQIQLCTDLQTTPVESTSVPWPEQVSPFVTVARITIKAQDISAPDNPARAEALSFTPWRTPVEHQPVGQIQTVRRLVYERASALRHRLNHQPMTEPGSPEDVLG